jgi:hypothetical protein
LKIGLERGYRKIKYRKRRVGSSSTRKLEDNAPVKNL